MTSPQAQQPWGPAPAPQNPLWLPSHSGCLPVRLQAQKKTFFVSGAVHYWLYTRQPCADPRCDECDDISTSEQRLATLLRLVEECARGSDYFHTINDRNVGRA